MWQGSMPDAVSTIKIFTAVALRLPLRSDGSSGRKFDLQPGHGCVMTNDSGQVVHTYLPLHSR